MKKKMKDKTYYCEVCKDEFREKAYTPEIVALKLCPQCYTKRNTKTMFKFEEKQGRLCIRLDLYLELDLDNKDLEKVFNEMNIKIEHPLLTGDYEIEAIAK